MIAFKREDLVDLREELGDGVFEVGVVDGPEGGDWREFVAVYAKAEAHFVSGRMG